MSVCTSGKDNGGDHYLPVMQALDAGCHVLCEKPISDEIPKAVAMVSLAKEKGLTLGTNMNRFNYAHRLAKSWITEGRLGHLLFTNVGMWVKPN